jgi:hypothetical protein
MFITYDFEVLKHDWIVAFKTGEEYIVIHNDVVALESFIGNHKNDILIGFNNHHYDDKILAGILLGKNAYDINKRIIIDGERIRYKLNMVTLDVKKELMPGVGLKSSQANLGMSIVETPVDFDLDRKLTKQELERITGYCKNDVKDTELLFKKRSDYFQAMFEIVSEFGLLPTSVSNTRATLASKVLECSRKTPPHDRLHLEYEKNINWDLIPKEVSDFFKDAEAQYRAGGDVDEIERTKLKLPIANVPHTVAFGGLHGAIEKYNGAGTFLQIDVASYYPSLIINNNFMSRASQKPEMYETLRDLRYKLKAEKNTKEYIYKILLNATFGAMKSKYNSLFDPLQANNICINGQLILIQLIQELKPYCQLIQSNTDGIVIKYSENFDEIKAVVDNFGERFNLKFDIDKIIKIAQRDVNNYAIQYDDGYVKAKGRFAKFDHKGFEQNTLTIIDRAMVNYYIHGKPIVETVIDAYINNDMLPFQIVAKMGRTYDGMFQDIDEEMTPLQKVNRVFATNNKKMGGVYKRKGASYQKIANTAPNCIVWNGSLESFDKSKLNLTYYIDLIKSNMY